MKLLNLFFNLGNNRQVFTVDRSWDRLPHRIRGMCEMAVSTIEGHKDCVHKDRRNVLRTDVRHVVPVEAVERWLEAVTKDITVIQIMDPKAPHDITPFAKMEAMPAEL